MTFTLRERIREELMRFKTDTIPFEDHEAEIYIATGAFEQGALFGFELACEMLLDAEPIKFETNVFFAEWLLSKMKEES